MMKKSYFAIALLTLSTGSAGAGTTADQSMGLGLDFAMPYLLTVNGNTAKTRSNMNVGMDGRWFINDHVSLGARASFDVEKRAGTRRQIGFAPGLQYRWMQAERFNPYIRGDVPIILRGAVHPTSSSKPDVGVSAGGGVAWNLGDAIGVEHMQVRYDFNLQYYFGLGSTFSVLAIEPLRIGFDYRF